jgi:hypothetical protein
MKIKFTPSNKEQEEYKDLTPDNVYRVISLEADSFVIMSDEGLPYSFPAKMFTVINDHWPEDWVENVTPSGIRWVAPKSLSEPNFFERLFDGDKQARMALRKRLQKWRHGED